jgi:hypothetical protein
VKNRLFDTQGALVLATDMRVINTGLVRAEFDEIRLEPDGCLITFYIQRGAAAQGAGSYPLRNVGVFADGSRA